MLVQKKNKIKQEKNIHEGSRQVLSLHSSSIVVISGRCSDVALVAGISEAQMTVLRLRYNLSSYKTVVRFDLYLWFKIQGIFW